MKYQKFQIANTNRELDNTGDFLRQDIWLK